MVTIKLEIKWAILFSMAVMLWMLLEKLSGLHDQYFTYDIYLTNLFAIPAITMIVLTLKEKKGKFYQGSMNYMQGLISGFILSIIITIISPLTQYITTYYTTPDYFPNVNKRSFELGYCTTTEKAKSNFNYQNYAIQGAIFALVMGISTTAIAMLFFCKYYTH